MLRVLVQHFQHVGEIVSNLKFTNEEFALLSAILLCPAGKYIFSWISLTPCMLGKICSRQHIKIIFLFFSRKLVLTFHVNCLHR